MVYFVATPIGNLKDITLRALETLKEADVIFCEDTRHTIKLLNAYEIKKPLYACHKFNEREAGEKIIEKLKLKKYLDDEKFAEWYVENRFVKKGVSTKRLKMELMKKGVKRELAEATINKIGRGDETEIKKIVAKKRTRYDDERLISYLVRQGFDYHLAQTVVRENHCETD